MKIKLIIPLKVRSANQVLGMHWMARNKHKTLWHEQVELAIRTQPSKEEVDYFRSRLGEPVKYKVTFTARMKRRIDQDNLFIKHALDGLKGRLISDDSRKYIESITTKQEKVLPGKLPDLIIELEMIE